MLCTVSCRAQPIHSFKLIIHLDDTVQRVITYISYQQMSRKFTYLCIAFLVGLWYTLYASVKSGFFFQSEII